MIGTSLTWCEPIPRIHPAQRLVRTDAWSGSYGPIGVGLVILSARVDRHLEPGLVALGEVKRYLPRPRGNGSGTGWPDETRRPRKGYDINHPGLVMGCCLGPVLHEKDVVWIKGSSYELNHQRYDQLARRCFLLPAFCFLNVSRRGTSFPSSSACRSIFLRRSEQLIAMMFTDLRFFSYS
jgi:hypothetical protein